MYNLLVPKNKLGKNALTLARDIIEKEKYILPTGHIPVNQQQATQMGDTDYWDSYPYVTKIKVSATKFLSVQVMPSQVYVQCWHNLTCRKMRAVPMRFSSRFIIL
jgi:hypothetical protein